MPPKMLTPPTTTAATTCSSRPCPAATVMLPKRDEEHEPGEAGQRAGQDEREEHVALDRHADELRRIGVRPDREQPAAERQVAEPELEHDRDGQREHDQRPDVERRRS